MTNNALYDLLQAFADQRFLKRVARLLAVRQAAALLSANPKIANTAVIQITGLHNSAVNQVRRDLGIIRPRPRIRLNPIAPAAMPRVRLNDFVAPNQVPNGRDVHA